MKFLLVEKEMRTYNYSMDKNRKNDIIDLDCKNGINFDCFICEKSPEGIVNEK